MAASQIRSIDDLNGPAGRLEALLNTGSPHAPYTALVCHPHPAGGGTMHNKVVYHATKTLTSFGLPVLRFNFRGTGLSEGEHDGGRGEQDDVRAGVEWLASNFARPILLAGFSFGAHIGMRAGCDDPRIKGFIGLGLPIHAEGRTYAYRFLTTCATPKLFISGDHDEFAERDALVSVWQTAAEPKRTVCIPGADHFFQGTANSPGPKLNLMQATISEWLQQTYALEPPAGQT